MAFVMSLVRGQGCPHKNWFEKSKFDDSIFCWYNNNKSEGLNCCHVDDFFWGETKHFAESLINKLINSRLSRKNLKASSILV